MTVTSPLPPYAHDLRTQVVQSPPLILLSALAIAAADDPSVIDAARTLIDLAAQDPDAARAAGHDLVPLPDPDAWLAEQARRWAHAQAIAEASSPVEPLVEPAP